MLHLRLATSAVLITFSVGLIYLDYLYPVGALWLIPLLLAFSVGTAIDVTRLWRAAGLEVNVYTARFGVFVTVAVACVPLVWEVFGEQYPADCPIGRVGWLAIATLVGLGIAVAAEMRSYKKGVTGAVHRIQATSFVIVYVGIPMGMFVPVRGLHEAHWGLAALISLIAATKSADAGAYFAGKMLGRNKLISRLSPGKTVEGAIGGVAVAIAVSYGMFHWLLPSFTQSEPAYPWWGPIVFGLVCALFGMFGDLAESLMKRDTGAKDSRNLLPGLGGVWDVTDSLIGSALPAYLCFLGGVAG